MKRVLAVSWEMPPMYGPRAAQVSRVLGQLPKLGWAPTAVCLSPRRDGPHWCQGIPADPPAGVSLRRVASPEESLPVRAAFRLVPALRDYPDPQRLWIRRAGRAAETIAREDGVAGIITFAQPWSDHLMGLRVHQRSGLPWVAHFSDPWVDSPYATPRQRAIWAPMESAVVRAADAIVFVTEETADRVMAKYPAGWRSKVSIVPHGFDPLQNVPPGVARRAEPERPLRLVHTGRFYSGVRTPLALFRALHELNRRRPLATELELQLIGPYVNEFEPAAAALGISGVVRFQDRVAPAEAARAADAADALLVIDAPSAGPSLFLPSKLIDYLPFRKPILGLTPEPGASASLLRRLECPIAPPDDVRAIAAALEHLIDCWKNRTLAIGAAFETVSAEYDIRRTAALLADVLARAFA
jgi:glycosyltransferase involved in cell wall biosynthesis